MAPYEQLGQYGVLGVMVVIFGMVIVTLWREFQSERKGYLDKIAELNNQRMEDAKANQALLVNVIRECTTALTSVTSTLEAQKDSWTEFRAAFRELAEEIRVTTESVRRGGKDGSR